jgi:hypothetical protein
VTATVRIIVVGDTILSCWTDIHIVRGAPASQQQDETVVLVYHLPAGWLIHSFLPNGRRRRIILSQRLVQEEGQ